MRFRLNHILRVGLGLLCLATVTSCATRIDTASSLEDPPEVGSPKPTVQPMQNLVTTQASRMHVTPPKRQKQPEILITQWDKKTKPTRTPGPRLTLSAQDVDIKTVLLALSKEIKHNIVIDPEIQKTVTIDLEDVSLREALDNMLKPLKLDYTIDGRFIKVAPQKRVTRIFNLNYIISRRIGRSSVQATSGSGVTGIGSTAPSSGTNQATGTVSGSITGTQRTASSIQSSEEANLWREIKSGLENLVGGSADAIDNVSLTPTSTSISSVLPGTGSNSSTNSQTANDSRPKKDEYYSINKQAGIILVRSDPETLLQVAEFLEAVEGSVHRQVFIEAKIIEVTLNKSHELGIDWSQVSPVTFFNNSTSNFNGIDFPGTALAGASNFALGLTASNLEVVVDMLATQGKVKVLSSPKIATMNNQRAVIKVGTEDVFFIPEVITIEGATTTEFIPETVTIGIVMDVVPQINPNGKVMMSINTSISEKSGERLSPDGQNSVPVLDVRESNNVVMANNGQTIVIGGLMKTRVEKDVNGIPFLQNIPYVGRMFQHEEETREKTELVIMLIPEIMAGMAIDDRTRIERSRIKRIPYPLDDELLN